MNRSVKALAFSLVVVGSGLTANEVELSNVSPATQLLSFVDAAIIKCQDREDCKGELYALLMKHGLLPVFGLKKAEASAEQDEKENGLNLEKTVAEEVSGLEGTKSTEETTTEVADSRLNAEFESQPAGEDRASCPLNFSL
jgi:hypothetical protein